MLDYPRVVLKARSYEIDESEGHAISSMSPVWKTTNRLSPGRATALILGFYLVLSLGTMFTVRPGTDESGYASPAYNLLYNGRMGTTIFELRGYMPLSMAERTYQQPPLYFLTLALWYRLVGFGLIQTRLLSVLSGFVALYSWNVIARSLFESANVAWIVTGLVSIDYFFVLGASQGRMDMMCAALGIAAIAVYLSRRKESFRTAMFWSHVLATMAVLTHPAGLSYWFGLAFLILYFDRRLLSPKSVALAAVPCLIGGLSWGAYIAQDPKAFFDQLHVNLYINAHSFEAGHWSSNVVIRNIQQEVVLRYAGPFGLVAGVGWANRLKAFVLLAYAIGIAGTLVMSRRRPKLLAFPALTILSFLYLCLASPSKFPYYLPHTTMFMAACFAVFVCHLELPDAPRKWMLTAAVLVVAAIQVSGSLYRIYQDPYRRSFLPAVAALVHHSPPGSLVVGGGELWFELQPQRRVLYDPSLGYRNGLKPAIFAMDPLYYEIHEQDRRANPPIYAYVQSFLDSSELVYDDGHYRVYVPQSNQPVALAR